VQIKDVGQESDKGKNNVRHFSRRQQRDQEKREREGQNLLVGAPNTVVFPTKPPEGKKKGRGGGGGGKKRRI